MTKTRPAIHLDRESELETSLHLYQPALYRATDGSWHRSFEGAVRQSPCEFHWDPAAMLSFLSFCWVCGDRTLIREVRQRPWLSRISDDGEPQLEPIPTHDTLWGDYDDIAEGLYHRLRAEALKVCNGRKEIIVLLSGGLDSRVAAGILAGLVAEGKLAVRPKALTWGMPDSRDVVYGRAAAELLGFEWIHANAGPEHLPENIDAAATTLAAMVAPNHLHQMLWFKQVPRDTLVIAASYGDSVGRAEFSRRSLLELSFIQPMNRFGLIRPEIMPVAEEGLRADLKALHDRTPGAPDYVLCEHEMQGHYMRGLISHAMSVIDHSCDVYQMFTDPSVYGYMWRVHPTLRFDDIYAALLEKIDPRLARLPWARNNRALRGPTVGAQKGLRKDFSDYWEWVAGPIHERFRDFVHPNWYAATGIFSPEAVEGVRRMVERGPAGIQLFGFYPYEIWLWLICVRRLSEWLGEMGRQTRPLTSAAPAAPPAEVENWDQVSHIGKAMRRSPFLVGGVRRARRFFLKRAARIKYPPRRVDAASWKA